MAAATAAAAAALRPHFTLLFGSGGRISSTTLQILPSASPFAFAAGAAACSPLRLDCLLYLIEQTFYHVPRRKMLGTPKGAKLLKPKTWKYAINL
ncbi:unnamed protein product [Urochloa humidicola]